MTARGTNLRQVFDRAPAILRELIRTSPRETAAGAVLLLVLTFTEGVGLLLLAPLLQLVGVVEQNPLPRPAGWLEDVLALLGLQPTLGAVLVLFVAIAAIRVVLQRWQSRLNAAARENLTAAYRVRIYRAIAAAEWRFLVTRTPSDFVHALTSEVGRVGAFASRLTDLAIAVLTSAVYLALALRLSPPIAVLVLCSAAILAWLARKSLSQASVIGARSSATNARLHTAVAEHMASLKTARAYGAAERHAGVFADLAWASRTVSLEVTAGETGLQQTLELGSTILLAAIVFVSAEILFVPPAVLLVLLYVFARLMPRLITIYRHLQSLALLLPAIDEVARLERECVAAAEPVPAVEREPPALEDSIRFEDVSFQYLRRASTDAVGGLTLRIAAGVTTAIVGPSGSGKSTLADLLLGLLSPTTGRVMVDGEPLTTSNLPAWRRQVSYVAQDTFLFDDTVRANLAWARPAATEAEMWEALRLAAADRFVAGLPQGIDTLVGERGVTLSGGERQRLSIARALLRQPRILVLDEATSSLDTENELRIQQAIDGLQHRMTIVIITHRLSTIRHADVIHVMEDGRVVQSGTWHQLLAQPLGRFFELARRVNGDAVAERV
ncbi:MAG: ABC transporter ATP-binding protein [Vicinamibacterales bacterium]